MMRPVWCEFDQGFVLCVCVFDHMRMWCEIGHTPFLVSAASLV